MVTAVTDPLTRTTSYEYYADDLWKYGPVMDGKLPGALAKETGPLGATKDYFYDTEALSDRKSSFAETFEAYLQQKITDEPIGGYWTDTVTVPTRIESSDGTEVTTDYHLGEDCAQKGKLGKPNWSEDPTGILTSYTYDANNGNMLGISRAGIESSTTTYYTTGLKKGRVATTQDMLGQVTEYDYIIKPNGAWGYNYWVQMQITTPPNEMQTESVSDAYGRVIESTSERGIITKSSYTIDGQIDSVQTIQSALVTESGKDELISTTTYQYYDDGKKKSESFKDETDEGFAHSETLVTSYLYDSVERLIRTDHPDGRSSGTLYYYPGAKIPEIWQSVLTDWPDDLASWPGRATVGIGRCNPDRNDGTVKLSISKQDPAGQTVKSYTYVEEGQDGKPQKSGSASDFYADGKKKTDYRITGFDSSTEIQPLTKYTYNEKGQLWYTYDLVKDVTTFTYDYDVAGRQIWTRNANDIYTVTEYDVEGEPSGHIEQGYVVRMHYGIQDATLEANWDDYVDGDPLTPSTLGPEETYVRYTYDEDTNVKTDEWKPVDDGSGEIRTHYDYDQHGRQTKSIYNYDDGVYNRAEDQAVQDIIYETVYDDYGNRSAIIDATGHYTWFDYDAFGRLYRKILDKDGDDVKEPGAPDPYEEYTYNRATGKLISERNYDGTLIEYTYDPVTGSQTRIDYPDGSFTKYDYFDVTNQLRLVTETDADGNVRKTSYAYDPFFRKPTHVGKPEGSLTYTYTSLGLLATVMGTRGDAGVSTKYFYDDLGRLETAETTAGEYAYTYYENGSRESLTLPNGVQTTYEYNPSALWTSWNIKRMRPRWLLSTTK